MEIESKHSRNFAMWKLFRILIALVIAISLGLIYCFQISNSYPVPGVDDYLKHNHGYFQIRPNTILAQLGEGESNIFVPESKSMDDIGWSGEKSYLESINWQYSDYVKIAITLNRLVWKDDLYDWKVYSMKFYSDCKEDPNGFSRADFTFFKSAVIDGQTRYVTRQIFIVPQYESIAWGDGGVFIRPLFGWRGIGLNNLTLNADNAIKIAEENGGASSRAKGSIICHDIRVAIAPNVFNGWKVDYVGINGLPIFRIRINAHSGIIIQ